MAQNDPNPIIDEDLFTAAQWYDQSINWNARLGRELPVLVELFGPPADGGILDAGCGTGRQALALSEQGYRVVGADASGEMLQVARSLEPAGAGSIRFVQSSYEDLFGEVGGGFDGLFCLGNALAASGSFDATEKALSQFAKCLRVGGRLFVQILNFGPMREENPCVRGPRVVTVDGVEYISTRQFTFLEDRAIVTNVTLWNDQGWRKRAHSGRLYPLMLDELRTICGRVDLHIDDVSGSYHRDPFDPEESVDLIFVATRQ